VRLDYIGKSRLDKTDEETGNIYIYQRIPYAQNFVRYHNPLLILI
jgi:hypothetical protein